MKKIGFLLLSTISLTQFAFAQTNNTQWEIIPCKSHIEYTAIQNSAPTRGQFSFNGNGSFSKEHPESSHVQITIDINSIATPSYKTQADTLKGSEWFDAKNFPQATFTSEKFIHLTPTDNDYQSFVKNNKVDAQNKDAIYAADGYLTIRNIKLPIRLVFMLDKYNNVSAHAAGVATLKRSQYGIGRNEWANTDTVKDDVLVRFDLTAVKHFTPDQAKQLSNSDANEYKTLTTTCNP